MSFFPRKRDPVLRPAWDKRIKVPISTSLTLKFTWPLLISALFFNGYAMNASAQDKVTICHKGQNTLSISINALQAHLKHGDTEGACLDIEPTSHDFGQVTIGSSSATQTFTLFNNSKTSLQLEVIEVVSDVLVTQDAFGEVQTTYTPSLDFHLTADQCSNTELGTIPSPSAACEFALVFEPQSVGTKTPDVFIPYADAFGNPTSVMVPIEGIGIEAPIPNISASLNESHFGEVNIGEVSALQTFRISNSGEADLQIGQVNLAGEHGNDFTIPYDFCSNKIVAPTQNCSIRAQFKPQAGGQRTATLAIASDDPDTPSLTITLKGNGLVPPNIEIDPMVKDFGQTQIGNATLYENVTILNTGGEYLQLGQLSFAGDSADFELLGDYCSNRKIRPGSACYLNIRFNPQVAGAKSATLSVPSDDPDMPIIEATLNGSATGLCQGAYTQTFSSYPKNLDFGTELVNNSTLIDMHVYSSAQGCEVLKIETIEATGTDATEFQLQNMQCYHGSWSNNSYSSCSFKVRFTPTSAGNKVAELTTSFNDATTGVWPHPQLEGNAVTSGAPNLTIAPSSLDFGRVTASTYGHSQTLTVTNTGNVNLNIASLNVTGQDHLDFYAHGWQCIRSGLAPGKTCSIYSGFNPKSVGDKQANLTIASNDPDTPSLAVSLTGTAEEPVDCGENNITIESSSSGVWATKTQQTSHNNQGHYWSYSEYTGDSDAWTRLKNPYGEDASTAPNRPTEQDVVRIKAGHTITGIPYANIRALCIEANATLQSSEAAGSYPYLSVYATDTIENRGTIQGLNGTAETGGAACTGDNLWQVIGQAGCAQSGAGISLSVGYNLGTFHNEGTIIAGHGGDGQRYSAPGGNVSINGAGITNTDDIGYINAGRGGDITGTQVGQAGRGGGVFIWGNNYLRSDGRGIHAGNGGNCNPNATQAQTGGNGGNMRLNARTTVDLLDGTFATGKGGKNCEPLGTNGRDGGFNTDPSILNLTGTNTKIEGGDITIFGGDDWIINLNDLSEMALTATGDITIAVGPGGSIDMTENTAKILQAGGQITLFADSILLDEGLALEDILEAETVVTGPGQILRDVSINAPTQVEGEAGTSVPITITLSNGSPAADTFRINLTDMAGWPLSDLTTTVELEALETVTLSLSVTLPTSADTANLISITAISQSDPQANATADIQVVVTESVSGSASIDEGIVNLPGMETQVEGGDVTITAGENGTIDLRDIGGRNVVTATGTLTLAVGENGVLDLRGNNSTLLETEGDVLIFADQILLDPGVKLSDLIRARNINEQASKPTHGVSLFGPSEISKPAGAVLAVSFTLTNTGVASDTYTLEAHDEAGWPLNIPVIQRMKGLETVEVRLNAGLISSAGSTNLITITATSQTDSNVVDTATIQVTVAELPGTSDLPPPATTTPGLATSPSCHLNNGILNRVCRNDGGVLTDITLETGASLAGGDVAGTITNDGLIAQVTVQADTVLTGGKLSGYITNEGTLADFEFVGAMVDGGTLAGTVTNNSQVGGVFKNVHLAADTHIIGGAVQGDIEGEAEALAILENMTIKSGTQLSNVILRGSMQFEEDISFGSNVRFGSHDIIPHDLELIGLLPELPAVTLDGVNYPKRIDFSADVVESSEGILAALNELPLFKDNAWTLTQSELGYFELAVDDIRYAVSPGSVQKINALAGMELQDAQSLRFITESGLGVLTQPALQEPSALQTALSDMGLAEFTVETNGNLSIPSSEEQWFSARPDWLSTKLASDMETGLAFGNSPYLSGLSSTTLIFNDAEGVRREQQIYPAVAYPEVLYSATQNVSIEPYGLVNFQWGNRSYRGVMDYVVTKEDDSSAKILQVESIPDANGDGVKDLTLVYPGGERQIMFAVP